MPVTDEQYRTWLETGGNFRAVLVEASHLNSGVAGTSYFANMPFVSSSSSSPADTAYDDLLDGVPGFSRRMSEAFSGRSSISRGDVVVFNDGTLDHWLGYHWRGQGLKLYLGDPSWDRDDFRLIVDGVCAGLSIQGSKLALKLRDKSEKLNTALPRGTVPAGPNAGKALPMCFGEVFNVSPLLIDSSTHKYQVHAGAIEAITAVRDSGVSVGFSSSIADGTFTLNTAPSGRITCDAKGSKPVTYASTAVDVVREILTGYAGVLAADIDESAMSALNSEAGFDVGLYVVSDSQTMLSMIDAIFGSVGAYWFFDRLGKFTVGRLSAPAGSPTSVLFADDISESNGMKVRRQDRPLTAVKMGYRRNWTPQLDGLAGVVSESDRDLYGREYSLELSSDVSILGNYPDAEPGEAINSLLVTSADAVSESSRRLALVKNPRTIYELDSFTAPFAMNLGDEISVTYPGLGFETGSDVMVVGLTDYPDQGRSVVEVWN